MIRRICRTLPRLAAVAALLLLAPSVQADDIEPEPYVEEEVEPPKKRKNPKSRTSPTATSRK